MKLADKIILHLLKHGRKDPSEIMIPNFYHGLYEMDVFKLMKTGYVVEYEVKTSRSDYFNDFKKYRTNYGVFHEGSSSWPDKTNVYKHDSILKGECANRFFFVVPYGLVKIEEIPSHCGLMYFSEAKDILSVDYITTIKPAPLIHKRMFSDYRALAISLSWREEHLRRRYHNVKTELNTDIKLLKQK